MVQNNNDISDFTRIDPSLSPEAPDGWSLETSELMRDEEGFRAMYRNQINGLTAELSVTSEPDATTVKFMLDDYTDEHDIHTRTRRYERVIPEVEVEDKLHEIATDWVERAEAGEWYEDDIEINPHLSPRKPGGWELTMSEPMQDGEGYQASYRRETDEMVAEIDVLSEPDSSKVKIILNDFTIGEDSESGTRRDARIVPSSEDQIKLHEMAADWVEKAEAGGWREDDG